MHSMDALNSSKNKPFFKKRPHRPWNTAFLENVENALEQTSADLANYTFNLNSDPDNSTELQLHYEPEAKTKEYNSIHDQLETRKENRLLIGGFLQPNNIVSKKETEKANIGSFLLNELKNKEQEILSISHELKIAKSREEIDRLEIARRKEEEARKSAESKALFAIGEAKVAAEEVYKMEQQLHSERQLRTREEKLRKILEEKNRTHLQEIEKKEHMLHKAAQERLDFETNIKQALEEASLLEKRLKWEAEAKIKKITDSMLKQIETYKQLSETAAKQASEETAAARTQAEAKIQEIEAKTKQVILELQAKTETKIQEAQKQVQYHEKMKFSAQNLARQSADAEREAKIAKKELESQLEIAIRAATEERAKFELEVATLLAKIQENEQEKTNTEKQLAQSADTIQTLKSIIEAEKNLRKAIKEKLKESVARIEEKNKIITAKEENIIELSKQMETMKEENRKLQESCSEMTKTLEELQRLIDIEKTTRISLETQLKASTEKVYDLTNENQKEIYNKQLLEQKILVLTEQKQRFEQEKWHDGKKLKQLLEQIKELQTALEAEKYLRKEAERLRLLEEEAKKAAQEKISFAVEQANKTVLTVLSNLATVETPTAET